MNRRAFLMATATSLICPFAAMAYAPVEFTIDTWDELKATDEAVILNFRASWSLTCDLNLEVIEQLIAENPAYGSITIVDVNWDVFGQSQMASRLKVERNSTLLVMKQGVEMARIVNEPNARKMRAFFDAALAA